MGTIQVIRLAPVESIQCFDSDENTECHAHGSWIIECATVYTTKLLWLQMTVQVMCLGDNEKDTKQQDSLTEETS